MSTFTLKNKHILIISPEAWGMNFVSKHHYAVHLAERGNQVYFLNPPSNGFACKEERPNLHIVDYKAWVRGIARLPSQISKYLVKYELNKLEAKLNVKFDILWNFDSSRFCNLGSVGKAVLKIQHMVDLTEDFQRDIGARTSDLSIGTTDYICESMKSYARHVMKVHHGYNEVGGRKFLEQCENSPLRIGYIGNLSIKYIDWETIEKLVAYNSEASFVFVGPMGKSNLSLESGTPEAIRRLQDKGNVDFTGAIPSTAIPDFLASCDILMVVYKASEYKEQLASPHKLMEYLGSGKVVVCSYTDEYKDKRELLVMADKNEELPKLLGEVIEHIDAYNSAEKQQQRIDFARDNTYNRQIERIEAYIQENVWNRGR